MSIFRETSWSFSITIFMCVLWAFDSSIPVTSLKQKNLICEKLHDCVCGFPSGQGINLTNLSSKTMIYNDTKDSLIFYLNPCIDAHSPCPNGSLFCVVDEKSNQTINLGSIGATSFSSQGLDNSIFLNFMSTGMQTEVKLECVDKPQTTLIFNGDNTDLDSNLEVKYHLLLQSSEACLKDVSFDSESIDGLSPGAVFFIVLIVIFCSYILVGAAANRFLRGATGWEVIPNHKFWKSVPSAFMDGVKFVSNGCRPPPSYEQI